jgi:mycothiol system anti-sigma-R factor
VDLSPIDCEEALRKIDIYVDGELEPAEAEMLRAHLGDCPPCGDRAEFQRRLKALLAAKCASETPMSLRVRLRAILVEGPPSPPPSP